MTEKKVIELDIECQSCNGTGLYSGMGESPNCAVVCNVCKGTGKQHYKFRYKDFAGRQPNPKIKWVYEANPGISVGDGQDYQHSDFGGMSIDDWLSGKPFKLGMENRRCTCPAWWYQYADYKKKPKWFECIGCGTFASCKHFCNKHLCWEKFDLEQSREVSDGRTDRINHDDC